MYIIQQREKKAKPPNLELNNIKLEFFSNIELLDLHFNEKLSWATQIKKLRDSCNQKLE